MTKGAANNWSVSRVKRHTHIYTYLHKYTHNINFIWSSCNKMRRRCLQFGFSATMLSLDNSRFLGDNICGGCNKITSLVDYILHILFVLYYVTRFYVFLCYFSQIFYNLQLEILYLTIKYRIVHKHIKIYILNKLL